jgi:hypothetical protein
MPAPREFNYRARFASRSFLPGAHASRAAGSGLDVASLVPLERARDARRIDLRASLRDPAQGWWARELHQRSSINIVLLSDLSASVAADVQGDRARLAREFAQALVLSAARCGDALGVIGFDDAARALRRPTRARAAALAAIDALGPFNGRGAAGVIEAAALLPRQRALVFLLSDFCWPLPLLDAALERLQRHDVVPVWLDDAEDPWASLPRWGLLRLADAESAAQRFVWWRPALRRRWQEGRAVHRAAVQSLLARHQRRPLMLHGAFDADAVSGWFAAR